MYLETEMTYVAVSGGTGLLRRAANGLCDCFKKA